jgi:hypothetical protein
VITALYRNRLARIGGRHGIPLRMLLRCQPQDFTHCGGAVRVAQYSLDVAVSPAPPIF